MKRGINFFPFTIVNKYDLQNKNIDKLSDKEILEYLFTELSKESFDKIVLNETSIELEGHFNGLFGKTILPKRTQRLKNGIIWIETDLSGRLLMFKYQNRISELIPLLLIPLLLSIFASIFLGICFFIFISFLSFFIGNKFTKLSISSLIEILIEEEFRNELNRRRQQL